MPITRTKEGIWTLNVSPDEEQAASKSHPFYTDAFVRYLNALDPAFSRALEASEFEFLLALLRIRGMQDAGWDPYETTLETIEVIRNLHEQTKGFIARRHLTLWTYGHILEASEPYELLANLLEIVRGGRSRLQQFPLSARGWPLSPGEKISRIEKMAKGACMPQVVLPCKEAWNRDFRNAIFHADYTLYGDEVRTIHPLRSYSNEEVLVLINRALAYHDALANLRKMHLESYTEPVIIPVHPDFSHDPDERATVIVREGYGATGLKDAWTSSELAAGKIPFRLGRFLPGETALLDANPELALLPRREKKQPPVP